MKQIGDFVETIHGVNGILTKVKKRGYYGDVAFIATSDMRTFYCPVNDIKGWNDHPTEEGETERQIQTAKTMLEKMVSCYDKTEKGGE